ncbi:MAG: hypothetical protein SPF89_11810 [Sphaerochaetaceae bacterium]|nr:hypothetical protein [Spirochaetales bacterium]MDY5500778.1 hypothetical protein [Sphaerochaetaceae bacterium]
MDENEVMDNGMEDSSDFADLEAMFGQDDEEQHRNESIVLTQNLSGFASCFPEWDLHPPVDM